MEFSGGTGVTLRFSGASRLDDAVAVLGRLGMR